MFLGKGVLKICSKFTGKHPCRSVTSIKFLCNFIVITLQHGCYPVNLLHIFRTTFLKNKSGRLLLERKRSNFQNKNKHPLKVCEVDLDKTPASVTNDYAIIAKLLSAVEFLLLGVSLKMLRGGSKMITCYNAVVEVGQWHVKIQ